jgi:hypothetical protein
LRVLALNKSSSSSPGRAQSCAMLGEVIEHEQYGTCGIYYPNTFNFAFSAALTEQAGETCLDHDRKKISDFVLRNQSSDGGWFNIGNQWVDDRVQSTAFAVYALAQFGDVKDPSTQLALEKGARFLFSQVKRSEAGEFYWPGEVFFTATAVARSLVVWRSDSFTTAAALLAILRVHDLLGWQPGT